jgi:epsilon-lactone hydrolase
MSEVILLSQEEVSMISPQAEQIRAFMKNTAATSIVQARLSVETRRSQFEALRAQIPLPADAQVEAINVESVAAEWVSTDEVDDRRVLLYLHGGGYVWGSCASYRAVAATFSRFTRARVLVLDYRLAPEHPFPAGLEDCIAAYRWLLTSGIQPEHIVLMGDSGGGGLTLATLVSLRQAGLPQPAGAVLISPWLDLTLGANSYTTKAETDFMDSRDLFLELRQYYLGEQDPHSPLASPLLADLQELPPMLVYAGSDEVLLDDSVQLAERLRRVGVPVELQIGEGLWHTWPITATTRPFPEGDQALEHIGAFAQSHYK